MMETIFTPHDRKYTWIPIPKQAMYYSITRGKFNMFMKMKISREQMGHIEKHQLISDELHGGQAGFTAHDALLTQLLTYNIYAQTKVNATAVSLDASKYMS